MRLADPSLPASAASGQGLTATRRRAAPLHPPVEDASYETVIDLSEVQLGAVIVGAAIAGAVAAIAFQTYAAPAIWPVPAAAVRQTAAAAPQPDVVTITPSQRRR